MKSIFLIVKNEMKADSRVLKTAEFFESENYKVIIFAIQDYLKKMPVVEKVTNNIKIIRIPFYGNVNTFTKIVDYFDEFYPEFIWCNDFDTLSVGVLFKVFLKRFRLIYDSHEWWAERIVGYNEKEKKSIRLREYIYTKFCDLCIKASPFYPIDKSTGEDFKILLNSAHKCKLVDKVLLREELNLPKNKKIIIYSGGISPVRGMEELIEAIELLDEDYFLLLLGKDSSKCLDKMKKFQKLKEKNMAIWIDAVDLVKNMKYIMSSDLGYSAHLNLCKSYNTTTPTKMLYYMMGGIPQLLSESVRSYRKFNKRYELGLLVDEKSPENIAKAITEILNDKEKYKKISKNVRNLALKKFSWEHQCKKLKTWLSIG